MEIRLSTTKFIFWVSAKLNITVTTLAIVASKEIVSYTNVTKSFRWNDTVLLQY